MTSASKKISMTALIVWFCCLIFYLYEFFLRTFIGTLAAKIIPSLSLNSEEFALMGAAYYIAYSFMQIPVGFLTDKFGAKKTVISATLLCACSVFLFSIAHGFWMAFLARFLMGLGSSFGFVTLLVVITNWFAQKKHALMIGLSQFLGTMGPLLAAGPLATLMKTTSLSWRGLLLRLAALGVSFSVFMLFLFRSKPRNALEHHIVIERPTKLLNQLKMLFKNKQAWMVAFFSALTYESIDFLGAMWGTYYLQSRGLSLEAAGYTISFGWLGFAIGCPLVTLISEWLKRRKPMLILCSLLGLISTALVNYVPMPSTYLYQILFFGIGVAASALNIGIAVIIEHVEISVKALALGFNNGVIILFGALLPVLASFFIHLPKVGDPTPLTFLAGFSILPLIYLIAFILALFFIKETFCRPQKVMLKVKKKYS